MSETDTKVFEGWCVLELFGHRRLAGEVSEATIAGHGFVRIDVPDDLECICGHRHIAGDEGEDVGCGICECHTFLSAGPVVTQFYSPTSVYALTPTTEAIARAVRSRPAPVHSYELPRPALPSAEVVAFSRDRDLDDDDIPL